MKSKTAQFHRALKSDKTGSKTGRFGRQGQFWAVAASFLLTNTAVAALPSFAYVSDQRVITVEPVSAAELILNVINLSDEVLVLHPYDLLLQSGSGTTRGQVFRSEARESPNLFYATRLVKPREFVGLAVLGDLVAEPDRVVLRTGSRFFFLQKMQKQDFDILARQVTQIDLDDASTEAALRRAGISHGYGTLKYFPDGETEALERLFPEVGQVLAPRVIRKSDVKAVAGVAAGSEIEIRGIISRRGDLLDARVSQGLSPEADRRALAAVENSWQFLPAVRDGEVVETVITLKVRFTE